MTEAALPEESRVRPQDRVEIEDQETPEPETALPGKPTVIPQVVPYAKREKVNVSFRALHI